METMKASNLVNRQYGKWNSLLATSDNGKYVFYQNHAKLFPEELSDWVTAIRKASLHNTFSPVRLDIDITNYCPNECIMCFARELREKHKTFIPLFKLKNIFAGFSKLGGKSVRLTGGGEPLSHPNILEIINLLAELRLKISIETNGDLITPKIATAVAKHVHHFRISVDSADNETRVKVHQPRLAKFTYDSLVEKIKMVRNQSIATGRESDLFIGATFVVLPENYLPLRKFVDHMYEIGVNWVALRKNIHREVYDVNPAIIPFIEKEIKQLKLDYANNKKNFIIEEQYGVSFSPEEDFNVCWVSHVRPIILANASLQLCCLARNGIIPEADIGKLSDEAAPIEHILTNNKKLITDFRNAVPKNCKFCIDKDNNISFSNIVALLKANKDLQFSKANVVLSNNNYISPLPDEISEVGLEHSKYELFKNGSVVDLR